MSDYNDPTGFAIATEQSNNRSDALLGHLVALRPVGAEESMIETSVGRNAARWCEALIVAETTEDYLNLGELPIFWEVIRRQLHDARPWLVGRIEKVGRAYRMNPPTKDEIAVIRGVLARHTSNPNPVIDLGTGEVVGDDDEIEVEPLDLR